MKPMFLTPLDVRVVLPGYRLLAPLKYITLIPKERIITVPDGFVSDFASIPRIGRWLITGHGKDRWGAVIHDHLYNIGHDRAEADRIFYEALLATGVNKFKARIMYRAVRTGGWMFYNREVTE